jgi:hypothetical protein
VELTAGSSITAAVGTIGVDFACHFGSSPKIRIIRPFAAAKNY